MSEGMVGPMTPLPSRKHDCVLRAKFGAELAFHKRRLCASVSSGCSSVRVRHQRRAAVPAPKDISTSDALLLRYA